MKPIVVLLAVTLLAIHAPAVRAQETIENELELIQQLRGKGWHDLAKQKIEELMKRGDANLNTTLSLELARVNIAIARQQDPEQRFALFTAARQHLQEYINKNQGKVQAALASAELARVTSYHAQAHLTKAMREDDNKTRHERARPAETMFIQAGKELDAAIKLIEAALGDPANANVKNFLQQELSQARFDRAINLFNQGRTQIDKSKEKVNLERAEVIDKARKAFAALSDNTTEVGLLAKAWLMKIGMEQTTPEDITKNYEAILLRKEERNAQAALRLAKYFYMQDLTMPRQDEPETMGLNAVKAKLKWTPIQRLHEVQKEGEAWLKMYPSYVRTYEGQGVLYELAHAYLSEAFAEKEPKAGVLFDKATKHLDDLAAFDGDLADKAGQISMSIKFKRLDTRAELKTFDEWYMKAMIERKHVIDLSQKADDAKPDEKKKIDEKRKKHLKDVIGALSKALTLTTPKTPVQKVDDARYYLVGAYLAYGDAHRAAIVGESLARAKPPTRRSPEGAATAIQTYSALQNRHPDDEALRRRLEDLANFVLSPDNQRLWGSDPVTGLAHYHLALSARRANDPKMALAHLAKIPKDFNDYIYTQGQAVFIAEAAREKAQDKKEKQFFEDQARAALARMPTLTPKNESSTVIAMYFYSKLELAKYHYIDAIEELNARQELKAVKKCNELSAYVKALSAEFQQVSMHKGGDDYIPNGSLSKQNHEQIQFSLATWLKYADLGIAETRFRSDAKDRFDQVLKATDPVVNDTIALSKKIPADQPIALKDHRVTGDILGLALRANVQKGNVERGKAILDVLKRLTGPEGEKGANVVAVLLNDIATQIRRMKQDSDPALKTTKGHYIAFLDEIAKEYASKGFDNNGAIMMAHAYMSLDFPCKAAETFSKVKPGVDIEKKVDKKGAVDKAWDEENNRYWGIQIEYVRALRACKEKESLATAEKVVERILQHPNAMFKIQAMIEKNLLLEDVEKYREAVFQWQGFLQLPAFKNLSNPDVQKVYFTGYFHYVRTVYKMGKLDPKIQDRPKFINSAGGMIVKLEFTKTKDGKAGPGWEIAGPMFQELLKQEKELRDAYEKAKMLRGSSRLEPRRDEGIVNAAPFRRTLLALARDRHASVGRTFLSVLW